jgi:cytochrome c oxidase assembly protein subunit 15
MERDGTHEPRFRRGPHAMAIAAAAITVPLLYSGGQVTTYRVGMAVPDWPTTFGINMFLYNMWEASWGVFIEHRHRLFGSALGLVSIALAAWFVARDPRRWVKALGVFALAMVCLQGLLGGKRVQWNSTVVASIHGASAQLIFGMMVALCVLTGRDWLAVEAGRRPDPEHLRRRAAVTLLLVYGQIVAGVLLRHFGAGLWVHALLAAAVWGHAAMLAWRVERRKGEVPELVPSARAMALAVTLQVALGVVAWWLLRPFDGIPRPVSTPQALVRTGHVVNGALLLGATVVLTLRAMRHLAPAGRGADVQAKAPSLEMVA